MFISCTEVKSIEGCWIINLCRSAVENSSFIIKIHTYSSEIWGSVIVVNPISCFIPDMLAKIVNSLIKNVAMYLICGDILYFWRVIDLHINIDKGSSSRVATVSCSNSNGLIISQRGLGWSAIHSIGPITTGDWIIKWRTDIGTKPL